MEKVSKDFETLLCNISDNFQGRPIHIGWQLDEAPPRNEIHRMVKNYMQWDEQNFIRTAKGPSLVVPISSPHGIILAYQNDSGHCDVKTTKYFIINSFLMAHCTSGNPCTCEDLWRIPTRETSNHIQIWPIIPFHQPFMHILPRLFWAFPSMKCW